MALQVASVSSSIAASSPWAVVHCGPPVVVATLGQTQVLLTLLLQVLVPISSNSMPILLNHRTDRKIVGAVAPSAVWYTNYEKC